MGYEIVPYLVDEVALRSFQRSNDEALIESMITRFADEVATNTRCLPEGAPTLEAALRAISRGEVNRDPRPFASQYAYALELLCRQQGKMICGPESTLPASIRISPKGLRAAKELTSFLFVTNAPLAIPDAEDFPRVGFWSYPQAARKSAGIPDSVVDPDDIALPKWWKSWPNSPFLTSHLRWIREIIDR